MPQFAPPPMGPRRASSIADLILRRGDIAARSAERSGMIWGNMANQLGQIGSQAFQQHGAQKAKQQQASAFGELLNDPRAFEDGPYAVARLTEAGYEPERAMVLAKGLGVFKQAQGETDPSKAMKYVPDLAAAYVAADVQERGLLRPALTTWMTDANLDPEGVLGAIGEDEFLQNAQVLATKVGGGYTLAPGAKRFGAENEMVAENLKTPPADAASTIRDFGGYVAALDPKTGEELWRKAKTPSPKAPPSGPVPEDVQKDIQALPGSWRDWNASYVTRDDFSVRGGQKAGAIAFANSSGKVLPTKKQAAAISGAKGTLRDINQAQKLLADPEVKAWLGRYRGTLTNFLSKGWAGDEQVPKKVRQFRANLNRLAAEERHRLYGAALTAIESRFADGFLPAITQPPSQIGSSLQEFVDDIERGMNAMWGEDAGQSGGIGPATHVWTPEGIKLKESQ